MYFYEEASADVTGAASATCEPELSVCAVRAGCAEVTEVGSAGDSCWMIDGCELIEYGL